MRHLWSLLAGIVAAPLSWLFLAAGQHRSQSTVAGWFEVGEFDTVDLIGPAAFLAVGGILLGLIGTLRWSPAGPLVAGLLLVVPTVAMFVDPFAVRDAVASDQPRELVGQELDLLVPVANGTTLVLAALLLVAVLSGARWRRTGGGAPAGADSPGGQPAAAAEPEAGESAGQADADQPTASTEPAADSDADQPEPLEPVGAQETGAGESRPDRE